MQIIDRISIGNFLSFNDGFNLRLVVYQVRILKLLKDYLSSFLLPYGQILKAQKCIASIFFSCRHYQYEQKLARLLWKVDWKDVRIMFENLEVGSQDVIEQVGRRVDPQKILT